MMNKIFEIKDLNKSFDHIKALANIDLTVNENEVLGIAGESGSGKTTLCRLMLKLIPPTSGHIYYRSKSIISMSKAEEGSYRREVQMVFQNPYTSLNPRMKTGDIVQEPLVINGKYSKRERNDRVRELFDVVGLSDDFTEKYPHELSGGERQRVGIARALSVMPKVLVLDEPVSSLDVSIQAQILNLLKRIKQKYDLTYVFVSHDLSVIRYLCDRVAVLHRGNIVEIDRTENIFLNPKSSYVAKLISSIPVLLK